jgi:type IV pilus assembly protein PilV
MPALSYRKSRGLTLVEILVALLVLSIGMLGLAGLQTQSLRFNSSSYHRTQATVLAYDFADRMRANRRAALDGEYDIALPDPAQACGDPDLDGTVPEDDIAIWLNTLACRLPQGNGAIVRVAGTDEFTFSVQWDEGQDDPMTFVFTTSL